MAVVITSKFYQEEEWKDISKVVFTSPNMTSPSIAGTRSNILPGQGALGMWYEDTSEMFRIEDHQWETVSDFYNFRMFAKTEIDLSSNPAYIDVVNSNHPNLDKYIQENSGVEVIGYDDVSWAVSDNTLRLEYTLIENNFDELMTDNGAIITTTLEETKKSCVREAG